MGNPASNTHDCFREFIGQKLKGLLFDALPVHSDVSAGTRSLIFEDGRALVLSTSGSYWIANANDVQRAIAKKRRELAAIERETKEVLAVAGEEV